MKKIIYFFFIGFLLINFSACFSPNGEFTGRKTIILSSSTRMKDVDEETRSKWYYDSYMVISKFARERKSVGMYCYSELDYFAEMARKTKKWSNVITRYQFYFPL